MLEALVNSKWGKRLITLAGSLFIGSSVLFNQMSASAEDAVLTVLCHGIKSQPDSMKKIEDAVKDQSYVLNVDYPSTEKRIKFFSYDLDLAIRDRIKLLENKNVDVKGIILVSHSMGGLVERYYIECGNASFADVVSKVKAIVEIAPPNHGSFLANVVCYHAALAGNTSDAIPQSIRELTKPKPKIFKILPFGDAAQAYKNLFNDAAGISNILNFVDSTWGRSSVFDLNTAPDGFIESELNKFRLRQGVYYCVIAGTDNTLPTATFMIDDPLYKFGGDSVVLVKRADISDLVKDKSNYRFETVKANHLNITENKDVIRTVKEIVSKFSFPSIRFFPHGWTSEKRTVKIATHYGNEERQIAYYKNIIGMEFVLIPSGEFMMGSEKGDDNERPVHRVRITKPFYIGAYEVTYAQYKTITGKDHPIFKDRFGYDSMDRVSWSDAVMFCTLLSKKENRTYHLPTEAEWEYACRAGSTTEYYFMNDDKYIKTKEGLVKKFAWYFGSAHMGDAIANPWGIYDMAVNFWEWCQDFYAKDYYSQSPTDDPFGPEHQESTNSSLRVMRGGVYGSLEKSGRSAFRKYQYDEAVGDVGFRVIAVSKD